ncbi:LysR family transcriptional regulator [Shewanella psychropiezotolerans]|uniref:LysR family transcriptional regulator n=1 Tax=Shewanella psychropiezotolerans TaxID=2593655 RepID=A0ABX5WX66_9GAMM|nr:LysR family transcriptional regulator [Shewanella psychropiezotolerans]QDO83664.1 LysR family transcriptional regulator [Shewanella psychropiezotolerans]
MHYSILERIQACDLNLLLSLAVLIEEQSVSVSAERLGLSQPTMSKHLKKLRIYFDDELFFKQGHRIKANDKALSLLPNLHQWLQMSQRLMLQSPFDASDLRGVIRIAFRDDQAEQFMPLILRTMASEAPHLELEFMNKSRQVFSMLERGELDLATVASEHPPTNIYGSVIPNLKNYAVYVQSHPLSAINKPTLKQILSHATAEYSSSDSLESVIDQLATQLDCIRQVTFSSDSMTVMLHGLLAGQHVGFVPERIFHDPFWRQHLLRVHIPEAKSAINYLCWHARVHSDPIIQWFKNRILSLIDEHLDTIR